MPPSINGILYGQEAYFLGFPFDLEWEVADEALNRSFPLPILKRSIVSAMLFDIPQKLILLDGINNPGFSGGPEES